jgi:HlyD family secretion protein
LVALLAAAAALAPAALTRLRKPLSEIPTARVQRGPLDLRVYTTGELRPAKTVMLAAPPVGGVLQIVHLAKSGTHVNPGDPVVEFDPSEQEYNLEQARSQLEEADQEIIKMKADAAVRVAQDKVSLLSAQFDLRRAELAVQGNDLLPGIEAKKNLLSLDEAKRRLEQMEQDIKSRASSDAADMAVQAQKRARAMIAIRMAQQNIDNMHLRAPIAGIVAVAQNMDAAGGIFFTGMELPEYREGDQASPGRLIAHVLDVEQMEIQSKVTETDRGNLESGQQIEARVDALPLQKFNGRIKSLAGMAASSSIFSDTSAIRSFDASFEFDPNGATLNPGCTAQVTIRGGTVKDALSLPRQALFQKEGKPSVYVKEAEGWKPLGVQIKYLTESRMVVEGISQGAEVALVNPELEKGRAAVKSGGLSSILGGILR